MTCLGNNHFIVQEGLATAGPILITVPHAGRAYTPELVEAMRDPGSTKLRLEDRYADMLAKQIVDQTGLSSITATAPRAMIDLNRAPEDIDWDMIAGANRAPKMRHSLANRRARGGLGLVPRRLSGSGEIWKSRLPNSELEERIAEVHRPYHATIANMLEVLRDRWGAALMVDFHSMPPISRRYSDTQEAEFVIGDRFGLSCDGRLTAAALKYFGQSGRTVAHNRPYPGGYTLDRHAAPKRGIHAIQLEICRSTYLDARLDTPTPRMASVAKLLSGLFDCLLRCLLELRDDGQLLEAAE